MEKLGEQDNIGAVTKSNLLQRKRRIDREIGLIIKGAIELRGNQSNQSVRCSIVVQNICNKETGRRIEESNGLSTVEHTNEIVTFYNERSEQGTGNMEEERLGMFDGHQISIQPCGSDRGVGEIPSVYAQRNTLHVSGNAFRDLNSTEDFCKDNINNNRQSEKQKSNLNNQLR
ncbi:MAG: hypothetical protein EZS28_011389 [Streblomastix strix]|uniref:Uncharacterized protein n=1 Tax=Streblomastix strix TaxID=222440 RepID=A0A5J4WED0_9EUKA|nr:MAG: hypothetical protein EZS28_011389 [Streblomastix strix]